MEWIIIISLFIVFGVMAVNAVMEMRAKSAAKQKERGVISTSEGGPSPAPQGSPSSTGIDPHVVWWVLIIAGALIMGAIALAYIYHPAWIFAIPCLLLMLALYTAFMVSGAESRREEARDNSPGISRSKDFSDSTIFAMTAAKRSKENQDANS